MYDPFLFKPTSCLLPRSVSNILLIPAAKSSEHRMIRIFRSILAHTDSYRNCPGDGWSRVAPSPALQGQG